VDEAGRAERIVLLGRPGSGKGIQGARLAAALGVPHVSTGDLVRRWVACPATAPAEIVAAVDAGELVADEAVLALVQLAVEPSRGVVLEGFPRTARQAALLAETWHPEQVDLAVVLDVPPTAATSRLRVRRHCQGCGATPPDGSACCDRCGLPCGPRPDDRPEVVSRRLWLHDREGPAVEAWFERRGVLARVDGARPADEVFLSLLETVRSHVLGGMRTSS
jgi:adenylate kinase